MGATASKEQSKRDGWGTSLSHSISLPVKKSRSEAVDNSRREVPWKAKVPGMPKPMSRESTFGNFFGLLPNLESVQEEVFRPFEEEPPPCAMESASKLRNGKSFRRSVSFQPTISHKSIREGAPAAVNVNTMKPNLTLDPVSDFTGFPCMDEATSTTVGLRSVLSPVCTPSRSIASPTRQACYDPKILLTPRRSFNPRSSPSSPSMSEFSGRASSFCKTSGSNVGQRELEWVPMAHSFAEPSFEKALEEGISDDSHQSSDSSAADNNSSASESESSADSDSFEMPEAGIDCFKGFESVSGKEGGVLESPSRPIRASPFLSRRLSFTRVFSLKNDEQNWSGKDYLDRFENICPPAGEGKVVLYFTSLRAVRKTFEDCCMLRLILKGLRVHVDERDVWMHAKFRKELTEVMGAIFPVPRLFILGRHIGGGEEVVQLHEEGILEKMVEGAPTERRDACEVCADVRFIPCLTCSGSCKMYSEDDVLEQCPRCNENGLIMCPECYW